MVSNFRKDILLAVLSGLLLSASFPPGRGEWLIWIALVPLLMAVEARSNGERFKLGLIAGMTHYLSLMYWVVIVLNRYGNLPWPISVSVLFLLSFYLALYWGLFCLVAGFLLNSRFPSLALSLVWVSLEFIRAKIFSGFPWCLLGYTQFRHLSLVQVTDITGVYGISFLIVFANTLLFFLFAAGNRKRKIPRLSEAFLFLLCLFSVIYYGRSWLDKKGPEILNGKSYPLAVVQGNIDQSLKWTAPYRQKTLEQYDGLTLRTLTSKPRLIVWPETAAPFFFQEPDPLADRIRQMAVESKADLIFGSPAFGYEKGALRYFNRAYHLDRTGATRGYYDKVHLVPFGEYVPLGRFFPFIQRLVSAAGDFTPGSRITPLRMEDVSAGILICFESVFPEIARLHTRQGADLLINITNDAWYGHSSAPYQTLCMSVFRAVENRRPLIRAANTGFSALIDHEGKILARTGLFSPEILVKKIRLVSPFLTFYTRYGDLFASGCLLLSALFLIFKFINYNIKGLKKLPLQTGHDREDEHG